MSNEVTWRVSPAVFSDLYSIIAKHGIGFPDLEEDMRNALFGDRLFGPDAAAMEILTKYELRRGIPLKVVVDFSLEGCERPEYESSE